MDTTTLPDPLRQRLAGERIGLLDDPQGETLIRRWSSMSRPQTGRCG
ncbi:hypothetical protein [Micropruina sp.]